MNGLANVNITIRGYSINKSRFRYIMNLDSDSHSKSNITVCLCCFR